MHLGSLKRWAFGQPHPTTFLTAKHLRLRQMNSRRSVDASDDELGPVELLAVDVLRAVLVRSVTLQLPSSKRHASIAVVVP